MKNLALLVLPTLLLVFFLGCNSINLKTDTENPLPDCPSTPNCKKDSFEVNADSSTLTSVIESILTDIGADTVTLNGNSINAIYRIPIFGWKDDVSILIQPNENSTIVYLRSASREGHWDIWANSIRVNKIIKHIKNELAE